MEMNISHTAGFQWIAETRNHKMTIDLPPEYNGTDSGPMSGELLVAALGSCVGSYAFLYLTRQNLSTEGLNVKMSWEDAESPRRICSIKVELTLPEGLTEEQRAMAMKFAEACKMHNTLCQKPEISFELTK